MSNLTFISNAFKSMKTTGAFFKSSKYLINKMLEPIDFSKVKVVVELGTGMGSITREILKRMPEDAVLYAFEINQHFIDETSKIKDSRLKLLPHSAELIDQYVTPGTADVVFSGLPLAIIPLKIKTTILEQSRKVLKPDGYYIQFQYSLMDRRFVKSIFHKTGLKFTLLNMPPAFVYVGRK